MRIERSNDTAVIASEADGSYQGAVTETQVKKKVLVVDDDPLVVRVLQEPLKKAGYEVEVASHGLEALQKVKEKRPDLIILDILMPLMDGFKVARFLKFDKRFKDIPIIVLTSRATEGERKMGEKVGANEFLYKPFRLPHVLDVVQRYLNA
ncbi:two-component system response regulator [candidate division KSB1 bacterium]|nr:MAG: two-component system response regulator [candidate division KSB1 bacterium]